MRSSSSSTRVFRNVTASPKFLRWRAVKRNTYTPSEIGPGRRRRHGGGEQMARVRISSCRLTKRIRETPKTDFCYVPIARKRFRPIIVGRSGLLKREKTIFFFLIAGGRRTDCLGRQFRDVLNRFTRNVVTRNFEKFAAASLIRSDTGHS